MVPCREPVRFKGTTHDAVECDAAVQQLGLHLEEANSSCIFETPNVPYPVPVLILECISRLGVQMCLQDAGEGDYEALSR